MVSSVRRFDTGEVELSYVEWRGESPPVLFLHGATSGWTVWQESSGLRGNLRGFAYDARGSGDSDRTPGRYRFSNLGGDALAFLERVIGEPAILVGHSAGAMSTLYVAAQRPDLVIAAALIDPPLYMKEAGLGRFTRVFQQQLDRAGKPVEDLLAGGLPAVMAGRLSKADPGFYAAMLDGSAWSDWETDSLLEQITCPVLLEYGQQADDREGFENSMLSRADIDRAKGILANVTTVEVEHSGHVPSAQNPEAYAAAISSFIAEHALLRAG